MAVGFEATLPAPGDMRPVELLGQPLVLVRGDDGVLRAFHNICPYDGCLAVRSEQRAAQAIEVYYHGWRYDLRGRLLAAPYWDGTPAGDPACLEGRNADLVEIRSGTRLGRLFVDLGGVAGPLDDHLDLLYRLLDEYDLDAAVPVEEDDTFARTGRLVESNWKTWLENAAINVLHESFTREAYRRSPDIPRVRAGEKTFFTVCEGPLLAFGLRMRDVPDTYASGGDTPHLGRSRPRPPSKGYFVSLYPNVAMPIRVNTFRLEVCLPETPAAPASCSAAASIAPRRRARTSRPATAGSRSGTRRCSRKTGSQSKRCSAHAVPRCGASTSTRRSGTRSTTP